MPPSIRPRPSRLDSLLDGAGGGARVEYPAMHSSLGQIGDTQRKVYRTQGGFLALIACISGGFGLFVMPDTLLPISAVFAILGCLRALIGHSGFGLSAALFAGTLSMLGFVSNPSAWQSSIATVRTTWTSVTGMGQNEPRQSIFDHGPSAAFSGPGSEEALQEATAEAQRIQAECRNRHRSGELKTAVATANCANPGIIAAFQKAGYRYMDLIQDYAAKRTELARLADQGKLTEEQSAAQLAQYFSDLVEREQQRDRRRQ